MKKITFMVSLLVIVLSQAFSAGQTTPHSTASNTSAQKTPDKIVGKTADGKTIYRGPQGGKYTINAKGDKVYFKK